MVNGLVGRRGSVHQEPNGKWLFVVDTSAPGAKHRSQTRRRGFPSKKAAQAALTETLSALAGASYVAPTQLTLRDYIENRWLPAVEAELRPSTFASYRRNLRRHVLPVLGDAAIQNLDAGTLTALYRALSTGGRKDYAAGRPLSATTVRYIHTILRSALQTAYEWDLLVRNPADRAKPPRPRNRGDRHQHINTWPRATLAAFLRWCEAAGDRLYPLWLLLATTGLRRGEALGLCWDCVDLDAARLSIRCSLVDVDWGRPVWSDPKTARGRRVVALDPATVAALKACRIAQAEDKLRLGADYTDHGLVFAQPDGTPLHPDSTSKRFRRLGAKAGLPAIRLHDYADLRVMPTCA
ncbi:MAG TPA: tyrosine-type recombinase/integrase [Mycobacteriales bacterium]|nr:tyrosine-type recombinase/integrase [Mycobacteriales bacterium]